MKAFCKTEIDLTFFQLFYYRRFYTGHHFRIYVEKWGILFRIGWNPYEDSRELCIFIGFSYSAYLNYRLKRLIRLNPLKMGKILNDLYKELV